MFGEEKKSEHIHLLKPSLGKKEEIFHEIIGLRRIHSKVEIGTFETRYKDYKQASKALKALIKTNLFHAGTIRTHYTDGSTRLLGTYVTEKEVGKQIVGDLLGYIVKDQELGMFETETLFLSRQSAANANQQK